MKDVDTSSGCSKPHSINLRVMRLVEPLPTTTNAPLQNHEAAFTETSLWEKEGAPCGIGKFSILPSSFGAVYGSEVFHSLISVFNRTSGPIKISSITVHLQTSSMRTISLLQLHDSFILHSKASVNKIVHVALREIGIHVLTCATTYEDVETSRTLRQFFRFNILPPNAPKQTASMLFQSLYHHPDPNYFNSRSYHSIIELRIINNTATTIYVLGTKFMPRYPFQFYPCLRDEVLDHTHPTEEDSQLPARSSRYATINKGDACTVTFQVRSQGNIKTTEGDNSDSSTTVEDTSFGISDETSLPYIVDGTAISSPSLITLRDPQVFKQHNVGRVAISWRSTLGENGLLRTTLMMSEPRPQQTIVDVYISCVPRQVYVHRTFMARCQVCNNSDKSVRLYLQVRRDLVGDIVPVGVSGILLGSVLPGEKASCAVPMIPLAKGIHSLSGFRVIDVESNVIYKARAASVTVL